MSFLGRMISSVSDFYKDINPSTLTGAIDVVVVEDAKGHLACTPFHVRFGKFKVFRTQDKIVNLYVNDKLVPINMKIGDAGEAFFVYETTEQVPSEYQTSPLLNPMELASGEMQKLGLSPELPRPLEPLSDSELYESARERRSPSPGAKPDANVHLSDSEIFVDKASSRLSRKSSTSSVSGSNWDWEWGDIPHQEPSHPRASATEPSDRMTNASAYFTPEAKGPLPETDSERNPVIPFIQLVLDKDYFPSAFQHFCQNISQMLEGKCSFSSCATALLSESSPQGMDVLFLQNLCTQNGASAPAEFFKELILDKTIIGKLSGFYLPINVIFTIFSGCLFGKAQFTEEEIQNIRLDTEKMFPELQEQLSPRVTPPTAGKSPTTERPKAQGFGGRIKRWFKPASIDEGVPTTTDGGSPLHLTTNVLVPPTVSFKEGPKSPTSFVKTLRLTGNQLKQLNLKHGLNYARFSLAINETVNCTARIFLWKETTKIVISDIDGTITKSDALGHIFTFVGKDWTHSGVANLYTLIHKNGYQFMYLTSRAIGQASSTREYLSGIEQNSFQLPVGPVIMSPDRLFTAFHREIILKKPEEFKIIVLKDICRLFKRTRTPFFAGFGNRETDVVSYRAVNIPPSKIFLVNPVGDVSLNNLSIFFTTSYTKLTALVDTIFPPMSQEDEEEECEDFNDFLYWRTPIAELPSTEALVGFNGNGAELEENISEESIEEFPFV